MTLPKRIDFICSGAQKSSSLNSSLTPQIVGVVAKGNGEIYRFNEDIRLNSRLASLQDNTRERNSLEKPCWCQN